MQRSFSGPKFEILSTGAIRGVGILHLSMGHSWLETLWQLSIGWTTLHTLFLWTKVRSCEKKPTDRNPIPTWLLKCRISEYLISDYCTNFYIAVRLWRRQVRIPPSVQSKQSLKVPPPLPGLLRRLTKQCLWRASAPLAVWRWRRGGGRCMAHHFKRQANTHLPMNLAAHCLHRPKKKKELLQGKEWTVSLLSST